ncbi:hypothetical protein BDV98DRAFT_538246 [Pterulicium gracile]|uniref:Uncharacterized protein n=1 Tax=Pterulicium gracile TaxID=1884261 RepID=A0A5C3R6S7_9AGAR|nr:hypothetical protein BDV98DRAFT_538246 [Pterula gracilis]
MDLFNPLILDASICDVVRCLSNESKVELLLYALRNFELKGSSRTIVDNAVQSCLQVTTLSAQSVALALVLRAKSRLAAGSKLAAQADLRAALEADPDHIEAQTLLNMDPAPEERLLRLPRCGVRFSTEIWREVARFLSRRDLKVLLFVPHTLSRVASQLLFSELDLFFTANMCPAKDAHQRVYSHEAESLQRHEDDARQAQRTADILSRIITDPTFAVVVKTLRLFLPRIALGQSVAFQTGMLANALPKLHSLRTCHISSDCEAMVPILEILQRANPRLRSLSLACLEKHNHLAPLEFQYLQQFSYAGRDGNPEQIVNFLHQQRSTLRTIHIDNPSWLFPFEALSIRNLTRIEFNGYFPVDSQTVADILSQGRQLDTLSLGGVLKCSPSAQFRGMKGKNPLPFLRHFSFNVHPGSTCVDKDLFPAIADFLRDRKLLTLHLVLPDNVVVQRNIGFDASLWGVLPTLSSLRSLLITYPRDLATSLAMWLVPRTVTALTLKGAHAVVGRDATSLLNQFRSGTPPTLRYISFDEFPLNAVHVIEHGFPMVQLLRIGWNCWSVCRREDGCIVGLEPWQRSRVRYHAQEWLEWLGCEDAIWPGNTGFETSGLLRDAECV